MITNVVTVCIVVPFAVGLRCMEDETALVVHLHTTIDHPHPFHFHEMAGRMIKVVPVKRLWYTS